MMGGCFSVRYFFRWPRCWQLWREPIPHGAAEIAILRVARKSFGTSSFPISIAPVAQRLPAKPVDASELRFLYPPPGRTYAGRGVRHSEPPAKVRFTRIAERVRASSRECLLFGSFASRSRRRPITSIEYILHFPHSLCSVSCRVRTHPLVLS